VRLFVPWYLVLEIRCFFLGQEMLEQFSQTDEMRAVNGLQLQTTAATMQKNWHGAKIGQVLRPVAQAHQFFVDFH